LPPRPGWLFSRGTGAMYTASNLAARGVCGIRRARAARRARGQRRSGAGGAVPFLLEQALDKSLRHGVRGPAGVVSERKNERDQLAAARLEQPPHRLRPTRAFARVEGAEEGVVVDEVEAAWGEGRGVSD
jgi:hypothetical protein